MRKVQNDSVMRAYLGCLSQPPWYIFPKSMVSIRGMDNIRIMTSGVTVQICECVSCVCVRVCVLCKNFLYQRATRKPSSDSTYAYTHTHTHTHTHTRTHTHTQTYTHIHTHTNTSTYTNTQNYQLQSEVIIAHTHIHTHIQAQAHMQTRKITSCKVK
jgi:hypothetical protein